MQVENQQDGMGGGEGVGEPGEPAAEQTKLGWTLLGPVEQELSDAYR